MFYLLQFILCLLYSHDFKKKDEVIWLTLSVICCKNNTIKILQIYTFLNFFDIIVRQDSTKWKVSDLEVPSYPIKQQILHQKVRFKWFYFWHMWYRQLQESILWTPYSGKRHFMVKVMSMLRMRWIMLWTRLSVLTRSYYKPWIILSNMNNWN